MADATARSNLVLCWRCDTPTLPFDQRTPLICESCRNGETPNRAAQDWDTISGLRDQLRHLRGENARLVAERDDWARRYESATDTLATMETRIVSGERKNQTIKSGLREALDMFPKCHTVGCEEPFSWFNIAEPARDSVTGSVGAWRWCARHVPKSRTLSIQVRDYGYEYQPTEGERIRRLVQLSKER